MSRHGFVDSADLTSEMAERVRRWRVGEEYSWRDVAEAASELWGSPYGSNQLYGEDLCAAAAEVLGEDFRTEAPTRALGRGR